MSASEVSAERKASRWEDYVDVFFSPAELFARRAGDSAAPAFWTLLLLVAVAYYAFLPVNEEIIRVAMATQAGARGVDPGEVQAAAGGMARIMALAGGVMGALTVAFMVAAGALVLLLVGKLVEVKGTYRQAFLICTYAAFVLVLSQVASGVAGLLAGDALEPTRHLSFGPLRFLDYESLPATVPPLLRRFELFAIWQTVLWGVGVYVVMKASKAQAAITAIAASLISAAPGLISAALGFGQQAAG